MAAKAYVVVGGTSGMGFAAATILAGQGARVCVIGRDTARAAEVAATIRAEQPVLGEGSDEGGIAGAIDRAIERLGGLDGLAVTAGPMYVRAPFLELTDADWAESFDTQLMTSVRAIRAAMPAMIAQGRGAIVTTAAYSVRAQKKPLAHYAAMKSAIVSVTKNIAKHYAVGIQYEAYNAEHYGASGIRANCIAPGAFAAEALDGARQQIGTIGEAADNDQLWQVMRDEWGMNCGLDRIGRPHEAGELIAFLLSDKAAYLTGALINIDGGTDF